jgi:hypothetical protein
MLPDLRTAVVAEYQKDLRTVAERRRRRLGALRGRIGAPSRPSVTRSTHSRRKEGAWKPF